MHVEYHNWFSHALGHDMSFKVYGHFGQPLIAFPAQDGRYYDFENFGMLEACAGLVEAGRKTSSNPRAAKSRREISAS